MKKYDMSQMVVVGRYVKKKMKNALISGIFSYAFFSIAGAIYMFFKTEIGDVEPGIVATIVFSVLGFICLLITIIYLLQPKNTMFYDTLNQRILLYYAKCGIVMKHKVIVFDVYDLKGIYLVSNNSKGIIPGLHIITSDGNVYISTNNDDYLTIYDNIMRLLPREVITKIKSN